MRPDHWISRCLTAKALETTEQTGKPFSVGQARITPDEAVHADMGLPLLVMRAQQMDLLMRDHETDTPSWIDCLELTDTAEQDTLLGCRVHVRDEIPETGRFPVVSLLVRAIDHAVALSADRETVALDALLNQPLNTEASDVAIEGRQSLGSGA